MLTFMYGLSPSLQMNVNMKVTMLNLGVTDLSVSGLLHCVRRQC